MSTLDFTATVIFLMAFSFSFYYFLGQELSKAERVVWKCNHLSYSGRGQYLRSGWATCAAETANREYFGYINHWTETRPLWVRVVIAFVESVCFTYVSMFFLGLTLLILFAYLR